MSSSARTPGLPETGLSAPARMIVRTSAYGRPAARTLHARLAAAKRDDALQPVTVVVPTNLVGVSLRRLLASGALGPVSAHGAGLAGVTLLTVYRLAELLGGARLAAAGRRPVSTPVLAAAVRAELAVDAGVFAPVAEHPATEEALVRTYRELSDVGAARLDALAASSGRAGDVVGLYRRARARLSPGWYDEADLMAAASAAAGEPAPVLADLGTVLVFLPQRLGAPAAGLLARVAETAPVEVVAGLTGTDTADADVWVSLRRLQATPDGPAEGAESADGPETAGGPEPVEATEVVVASDAEAEVRVAVRRVLDAARAGTALERIAVLYPQRDPYARLVHERLDAVGVPANGQAVRPLLDRVAGRWVLDLLALADRDFARDAVLDVLASAPVVTAGGRPQPVARFERVSRDAGVVAGDWQAPLARHASACRATAAAERDAEDPRQWLIERCERDADDAERLAALVRRLRGRLEDGARRRTWQACGDWLRDLVAALLGDQRSWRTWPPAERDAAERVDAALDRLAMLDTVGDSVDLDRFRRTLELELDDDLGRVGRFGEGVLCGELSAGLGIDLDLVVVCGLAEGVLPARTREDSLLPDAERRAVGDELRTRRGQLHLTHRHLLAALESAPRRVLCYPRGDLRRSTERPPSRWLLDVVAQLPAERPLTAEGVVDHYRLPRSAPWLTRVPSFAADLAGGWPATAQDYRLRALGRHRRAGGRVDEHPLAAADAALSRGLALHRARRSDALTRFDGDLSQLADLAALVPSPLGAVIAPTSLQAYARCPRAYLDEHVLGVRPLEAPEELVEITRLDLGSLLHDILDRWLSEVLAGGTPAPGAPFTQAQRARLVEIAERCCDEVAERGLTGHPRLWVRQREVLLRDLDGLCDDDDVYRAAAALTPHAAEVAFGLDGREPVVVTLPDGRQLRFRGRIDRVDVAADGALEVTDYKIGSGTRPPYTELDTDPVARGSALQLPVYAVAARQVTGRVDAPVRAQYWFCTARGEFKRRRVDLDAARARFDEVLRVLIDHLDAGLFPARPPVASGTPWVECRFCDPDGLGATGRRRDWERKRADPRLAGLVALVEPAAADGGQAPA